MSNANRKLARELRSTGVSNAEIVELTRAAERLSTLHVPGMSAASRQRIAARMPVDVELEPQRFGVGMRWAAAGAFAAVAVIAGVISLVPGSSQPASKDNGLHAHQVTQPPVPEQQLEQQVQQLEQLQKQPTVDQQQVQKAKDDFEQTYKNYQKSHTGKEDSKTRWNDYKSQWWWNGASSSQTKSSSSETGSSVSQPADDSPWRRR